MSNFSIAILSQLINLLAEKVNLSLVLASAYEDQRKVFLSDFHQNHRFTYVFICQKLAKYNLIEPKFVLLKLINIP